MCKGEEVFISYGQQSNDRLLQFYGFVEASNPADVYVIRDAQPRLEVRGYVPHHWAP